MVKKKSILFRLIIGVLIVLLISNNLGQVQAQPTPFLPNSSYIDLSIPYSLPVLRGMRVYPDKPFEFDFVVDSGDRHAIDQKETSLLIKYFLTFLTIPEEDLWVNLSPYEAGRIIPNDMALTNAGNTLLEQDKLLKQLSSSLTYPETSLGKKFWEKVYKIAHEKYGTTNLPINTYNKVWIVPDKAIIYDMGDSAMVGETHLKVLLEEDYLALKKNRGDSDKGTRKLHTLTSEITKEIILPQLEKEINEGKNFAPVRQIFYSLVLADWFKRELRRNILSDVYVNKKKISGVDNVDKNATEKIYKQYLHIFRAGAYNYIREDVDPITNQVVPRKYFSGGCFFGDSAMWSKELLIPDHKVPDSVFARYAGSNFAMASVKLKPIGHNPIDSAQLALPLSLRKFVASIGLAVTLFAPQPGGLAQAQEFVQSRNAMPMTQQARLEKPAVLSAKIIIPVQRSARIPGRISTEDLGYVQMAEKLTTLDDVKALNGLTNPVSGNQYNIDLPWMERNWNAPVNNNYVGWVKGNKIIAFQHKNGLLEDGQLRPETKQALAEAVKPTQQRAIPMQRSSPQPVIIEQALQQNVPVVMSGNPPPQINQQPAAFIQNKVIYTYAARPLQPTPVTSEVVAKTSGDLVGLNNQKNINEGELIATLLVKQNKADIETLSENIKQQEATVKLYESGFENGASSYLKVIDAKLGLLDLKMQLAKARGIEKLGEYVAPYNITVRDTDVREGDAIRVGRTLKSYYNRDRLRFDIVIPRDVYFENMVVTLDGHQGNSSFWYKESPTVDYNNVYLGVIVTPSSPIDPTKAVPFSAKFYAPDKGPRMPDFKGRGSSTTITVGPIKEYSIPAPESVPYEFKVHQGDKVKKGQVLARGDTTFFKLQLEYKLTQMEGIDLKLNRTIAPDGTVILTQSEIDKLTADREKLSNDANELKVQMARLSVTAQEDGTISWTAQNASNVLQYGDDLFRINNDTVLLGNLGDAQDSILFSKGVKAGDMVEGMTPAGPVFGIVTAVDPTAHTGSLALGSVSSVEVTMKDPQHLLRYKMTVTLKLLTDQEKAIATDALKGVLPLSAGAGAPPPPELLAGFASGLFKTNIVGRFITPSGPQAYYAPTSPTSIVQVLQEVNGNQRQLLAKQYYDVLEKKVEEGIPGARKFSIFGSLYGQMNNGKFGLSGFGGASGVVNGVTSALTSGSLLNYGFSIFGNVLGNVVDIIDGKIGKEEARNRAWTKSAEYSFQSALAQQISTAKVLYTRLGVVQQGIAKSKALMEVLKEEQREAEAAEGLKLVAHAEVLSIHKGIPALSQQIQRMEGEEKELTSQLNNLRGQKIVDGPRIIADLPLTGDFKTIPDDQKQAWLAELTGPNSKDPRLLKARADLEVVLAEMKVEGLKNKPTLTVGSLIPNSSISTLPYEPYGSGAIERGSSITGAGGLVQAGFDIKNQKLALEKKSLSLQKQEAEATITQTVRDIETELENTVNKINEDGKNILTQDEAYQNALGIWQIPASQPGIYVPYQYDAQRQEVTTESIKGDNLKKDYLEQQETLRKMGISDALVKDKAQVAHSSPVRKFVFAIVSLIALAVGPIDGQDSRDQTTFLPSGAVYGTLRSKNPASTIVGALNDANPLNRLQALDLIKDLPNTKDSIDMFERIAMSASPEVRQEMFRIIVDRQDLRFLIQMIDKTDGQEKRKDILNEAYQAIGDIFTDSPVILDTLRTSSFTPTVNYPDQIRMADKVFLAFIAGDPQGLGQTNLLLSKYWRTDELARLHNNIGNYLRLDSAKTDGLKKLIFDVIVRRIFLETNEGHFTAGELQNSSSFSLSLFSDNVARLRIKELPNDYQKFFNSPQWRQMGNLRLDLLTDAERTAQGLIDQDKLTWSNAANNTSLGRVPGRLLPQDSLALLGTMDFDGQQKYIARAKNSELARILGSPDILQNTLLFNEAFNRLMADSEGRILILKTFIESSDKGLRQLIEAQILDKVDTVKQDAKVLKSPAATGIFREALNQMHGPNWIPHVIGDTYSSMELYPLIEHSPVATKAQVDLIAMKWAVEALKVQYPELAQKDMFIAGQTVYSSVKTDTLNRLAEKLESLNDAGELEGYLKEQAARSTGDKEMINDLTAYSKTFAGEIEVNNQEIKTGSWWAKVIQWQYHTDFYIPVSLVSFGLLYTLLPMFQDWRKRRFSSLEELMKLLEKDFLNAENRGEDPEEINSNRVEPSVRRLLNDWNNRLKAWSNNNYPVKSLLSDQDIMIRIADKMISLMPYTPDLMNSTTGEYKNQLYQDTFAYFVLKANKMSKMLADRFVNDGLTPSQRQQFLENNEKMLLKLVYVEKYLDILQDRANVNTGLNEQFSKHDWKKEIINAFTTWSLGYRHLVRKPQKNLERDIRDLMRTGNVIIPGFYNDIEGIVRESKVRLKGVITKGKRLISFGNAASRENTRMSSWVRRLAFLIPSGFYFFKSIIGMMGFYQVNWFEFVFSIGGLFFSFSNYWSPILSNLRLSENKKMKEIMIRLHNRSEVTFNAGRKVKDWKALKNKIVEYKGVYRSNPAMSSGKTSNGGIDLNFQPQYIRRPSGKRPVSIHGPGVPEMSGFRGFNFNIVRFTPELTVNGAFQLMYKKS